MEAPPSALLVGVDSLAEAVVGIAVVALAALAVERLSPGMPERWTSLCATLAAVALVYLPSIAIVDTWTPAMPPIRVRRRSSCSAPCGGSRDSRALVVGLVRDERRLRLAGFGLLAIAVAKVFLFDLTTLESIYRVASFIALGLLLLTAAFAYQRLRSEPR